MCRGILLIVLITAIAGAITQADATSLALLVCNRNSLDSEELASFQFATSQGYNVAIVDAGMILDGSVHLSEFPGFWANSYAVPSAYDNPTIVSQLLSLISQGRGMLIMNYGSYIAQYMGLGPVLVTTWCPYAHDSYYFVDTPDSLHLYAGIPQWIPPVTPDHEECRLWTASSGCRSVARLDYYSSHLCDMSCVCLITTYGWPYLPIDPQLCARYNYTCTPERALSYVGDRQKKIGNGLCLFPGGSSFSYGNYGPAGQTMLANALRIITSNDTSGPSATKATTWGAVKALFQ